MSTAIPASSLASTESNQDEEEDYVDDEPQNGLTLLSELSSHEYSAIYDAVGGGPQRTISSVVKSAMDAVDDVEEEEDRRHYTRKRRQMQESPTSSCTSSPVKGTASNESTPRKPLAIYSEKFSTSSPGKALNFPEQKRTKVGILHHRKQSSEVGRRLPEESSEPVASTSGCSRTRPSAYDALRSADIHSEIAAARNSEQISLAINSIIDNTPASSAAMHVDGPFRTPRQLANVSVRGTAFSRLSPDAYPIRINSLQLQRYAKSGGSVTSSGGSSGRGGKFVNLTPMRRETEQDESQRYGCVVEEQEVPQEELVEEQTVVEMNVDNMGDEYKQEVVQEEGVGGDEFAAEDHADTLKAESSVSSAGLGAQSAAKVIRLSDLRSQLDPSHSIRIVRTIMVDGQPMKVIETTTLSQLLTAKSSSSRGAAEAVAHEGVVKKDEEGTVEDIKSVMEDKPLIDEYSTEEQKG